jgi:type I restriction enzyme S subunit
MEYKLLGEIATYVNGYAFKPEHWGDKGLPIIRIQNLTNPNGGLNYYDGLIDEKYIVNPGDVLIAWSASLGVFEWNREKALLNQHIFKVVFDKIEVDKTYFKFMVSQALNFATKYLHGSTMKHITKKYFDNIQIPFPSLTEQKYIGGILEKVLCLKNKRESQITALNELTQSLFLEMFGDPAKNPRKYPLSKLKDICIKITDGTHHSPPMVERGIPYVSAKHLGKGYLDFYSNPTYISKEEHEKIYKRCDPINGDVLYIKDGATTGIAGINYYDFEFSMLSSLALIRPDSDQLINYYLVHYLNNARIKENIISNMSGGAIKRLTIKKITDLSIVVPPIKLQREFAEKVKKINQQKELLKSNLKKMHNLYGSLLQKAFKGELFQEQ